MMQPNEARQTFRVTLLQRLVIVLLIVGVAETTPYVIMIYLDMRSSAETNRRLFAMEHSRSAISRLSIEIGSMRHLVHNFAHVRETSVGPAIREKLARVQEALRGCAKLSCHTSEKTPADMVDGVRELFDPVVPILGKLLSERLPEQDRGALGQEIDGYVGPLLDNLLSMHTALDEKMEDMGEALRKRRQRSRATAQLLALAVVVCAILVSLWLARRIAAPLRPLLAATRRVAKGDYSFRIPEGAHDELGALAAAFNLMAERLREAQHVQDTYAAALEHEVRKRLQEILHKEAQLQQAERLASMGMVAGGIAHEINNPVTGILMNTGLLIEQNAVSPEARPLVAEIDKAASRCQVIVEKLLELAGDETLETVPVDLADVIRYVVDKNKSLLDAKSIELRRVDCAGKCMVAGDMERLVIAVDNIVRNAVDVTPSGGVIEIRVVCEASEGRIEIADSGPGVDARNMERIFEPFFTERPGGTGLGLAICRRIVERLRGRMSVEGTTGAREDGGGATFTIALSRETQ